ncbi:MAG: type II toxin-antitoxin system HipA family toxin [Desulfococcaceae bacterium]
MKPLAVFINDTRAGRLWQDEKQRFVFQYSADYLNMPDSHPLSLSLPLQDRAFDPDAARPFFSNLLPEGHIRDMIAGIVQVSKKNDMALLEKIGEECAGAVSVLPEGIRPDAKGRYIPLSPEELDEMTALEPRPPLLVSRKELRLSLAGAQDKLPVFMKENSFFLSSGNKPSSHIVKPQNRYFEDMVQNEAFCMMLAKAAGLSVPPVFIRKGTRNAIYIIERYDRIRNQDGSVSRMHQEDFCQAMGLLSHQKYQSEGGPGLADCFDLIRKNSAQPLIDRKRLMEWVIFNFLIGNADAHAKNISLLFHGRKVYLAPFYDLISTLVYPDLLPRMSMKIGGENRFRFLQMRHWERFAEAIDVKTGFLFSTAGKMAEKVKKESAKLAGQSVPQYGGKKVIEGICEIIAKNAAFF